MGKFNAPPEFAANIPQAEKYERWVKWKCDFDIAVAVCDGEPSDFQKAGLLHTHAGNEIREVIRMLKLPPLHEGSGDKGQLYKALSSGLNDYFYSLVDETMTFARFTDRKQKHGESTNDYAIALRQLAQGVGIVHGSVAFRHQFLSGISNRPLAGRAVEEGLSISEVIQRAGRIEQSSEAFKENSWAQPARQAEVMAISSAEPWKSRVGGNKRKPFSGDKGPQKKKKQCGTCGRNEHQDGRVCPAIGKSCLKCGGENHFASVCKSERKGVEAPKSEPSSGGSQVQK